MRKPLAHRAMIFAHVAHRDQKRKYLNNPYTDHLAEVVALVAGVVPAEHLQTALAVAWLHDVQEDQNVPHEALVREFGVVVAEGVHWLTDREVGNRVERKAQARERLARAPGWVQTIKMADCISNYASIRIHDPKFAAVYRSEILELEAVLKHACPVLRERLLIQLL